MARIFKRVTTRYLGPDKRRCQKFEAVTIDSDGKDSLRAGYRKVQHRSCKWYGCYRDADGLERIEPLSTNKEAAKQMLNGLVDKVEREKVGWVDPYESHRPRPLVEHLADFEQEVRTKVRRGKRRPPTPKQLALKIGRIRRVLDGCNFRSLSDLALEPVQAFLTTMCDATPADSPDPAQE
jgi:hypothetical protein